MKSNFRICPQCATRNRLDKEFCVKCGEPLEGVKAGDAASSPAKGKPGFIVTRDEQGQNPIVPLVMVLLALGVALAGWNAVRNAPPPVPVAQRPPLVQASIPAPQIGAPVPGVAEYAAGVAAMGSGDLPNAVRSFREAVAASGLNAVYRFALADALDKSGATNDSLIAYESAAQLDAANLRYLTQWARALGRAGRSADAVKAYETALGLEPDNIANLRDLANLHFQSSDPTKARPYLERIVRIVPAEPSQKMDLARVLEAGNDLKGAAEQYQNVLALTPRDDLARALLSEVYMKQSRSAEAMVVLDEGLKNNASAAMLYREKGRVLDRLGRDEEAILAYREYVRLAPGASDIRVFNNRIAELSPS